MPAPPGYDYVASRQLRIGGVLAFTPGQYVPDSTVTAQGWSTPGDVTAVPPNGASVGPPTDGQVLAWSATLGQYTPVGPSGLSELAYAENTSGTYQSVAVGTPADLTGCVITVPISTRPVYLSAGVYCQLTGTGVGNAALQLIETTGTPTVIAFTNYNLHGEALTTNEQNFPLHLPAFRIGPTAVVRTFKLTAAAAADSGAPAYNVYNGLSGGYYKSWIAAEAR